MEVTPRARALYDELAQGWNTWSVHSVASQVFLPDGLEVAFSIIVPDKNGYCKNFTWPEVVRFGEHSIGGDYTEVEIEYLGSRFVIETAAEEDSLVMRVKPVALTGGEYIGIEVHGIWGGKWDISESDGAITAVSPEKRFRIDTIGSPVTPDWNPIFGASIVLKPSDKLIYVRVNVGDAAEVEIDELIDHARENWLSSTISADGDLGEGLEGLRRVLLWNTIFEPRNKRVVAPVSRNWCQGYGYNNYGFGHYVLFGWDTFFDGLMSGLLDKRMAYAHTFSILEEITPEGFIPNVGSATRHSRDRSEPQVGSWCVWKLYLQFGDEWFLEECFDRLLTWNDWRFRERDCNGDGLLELASTPWDMTGPGRQWCEADAFKKQGAMWESGLDNSPMWDDAAFNEEKHCLELSYVGLNAEMVADCECLAKIARVIGRNAEAERLEARGKRLGELMNAELWDESRGTYLNKDWQGKFSECMSLTHFYPLMAGIASPEQMQSMFYEHILNTNEFWGDFVIPMTSRDDPAFINQDYWRGRVWGPTNFLVSEGIRRSGRVDVAAEVAEKSLRMFVKNWREKGIVCENYNVVTGEGSEPGKASDKFYHWGALLVYMAVQEFFDCQAWDDTVKLGREEGTGCVRNIPLRDAKVDVFAGGGDLAAVPTD